MILYADSSALVKRYVEENGTREFDALWDSAGEIATSTVAFAECMAAFRRKYREGIISERDYQQTIKEFKKEYSRLILVQINPELNWIIEDLLASYSLRGFDSIHLASALAIKRNGNLITTFACFYNVLNNAAGHEGLDTPLLGKG